MANRHRRARASWRVPLASLLGLGFLASVASAAVPPVAAPPVPVESRPAKESPLDEPLRLLTQARKAYAEIEDYTCTLIKRERLEGQTTPTESVLVMAVRSNPFSVSLRWQEPRELIGQEVCYVEGKNNGRMRVRSAGALGALGFVSIDPNDARARKTSRHCITEAGLGNLIERYAQGWEEERRLNQTTVQVATYEFNKRRCVRVETIHPPKDDGRFAYYRNVVYFDKETHLPVRVECYDWPHYDGDKGEAIEVYSYVNLRTNVGLGDVHFNK